MIVEDFLLSCISMSLSGMIWTLTFHQGWFGWVPWTALLFSLRGLIQSRARWRRARVIVGHPPVWTSASRGWLLCIPLHHIPTKAEKKTHQMKTCGDLTSKIGFQGICCDNSHVKLVYFLYSLCLQQHSIFKPDVLRADCVEWKYSVVEALRQLLCHENIKTKIADRHHYVATLLIRLQSFLLWYWTNAILQYVQ